MQRIKYLDIAKGIAIILVVLGHSSCPQFLWGGVYAFHMPLFFFISGCFFPPIVSLSQFRIFVLKKVKGLYMPLLVWSIGYWLIGYILYHGNIYGNYETNIEIFKRLCRIVFTMSDTQILGSWFIQVLFVDFIFLGAMSLLFSSKVRDLKIIMLVVLFIFEMVQMNIRGRSNYLSLFIVSSIYILCGGYLRYLKADKIYLSNTLLLCVIFFSLLIGFFYSDEIPRLTQLNWISYMVLSIPGIICTLSISKRIALYGSIPMRKSLEYFGKNTYTVLTVHGIAIHCMRQVLEDYSMLESVKCIIYMLFALTTSILVSAFLDKLKHKLLISKRNENNIFDASLARIRRWRDSNKAARK